IDIFGAQATVAPSEVLVEFFHDEGGRPGDSAHHAVTVDSARLSHQTFEGWGAFSTDDGTGMRMSVDLSGIGVELGAGTWWVSAVPIGNDTQYGAMRVLDQATGSPMHFRHGGDAHGNGYPGGVAWGDTEWMTYGGQDGSRPDRDLLGDLAIRVEGTLVPAPGGLSILGLMGLAILQRRR